MKLDDLIKTWSDSISDSEILVFSAGDVLFREGEKKPCAFIILDGEVKLTRKNSSGKNVLICRVGRNELVGAISLIEDEWAHTNTATVYTDKLKAFIISKERFDAQFNMLDFTHQLFIRLLSQRLRNTYRQLYKIV